MRLLSVSLMLLVVNQAQSQGGSHGPIRNSRLGLQSSDPCRSSPCGPNTRCDTTSNGIAQCRCLDDFIPDGDTINGCTKRSHAVVNPCSPNPCGTNAECHTRAGEPRPVCTCPIGYEGDPLTNCTRGDCIEASDCPAHLTCQKLRCINPCNIPNICGRQAECQTRDHQPICSCGLQMVGDPFIACRVFNPSELCRPSPCGRNTKCRVSQSNDRAVCSCIDNYIGDPLTSCNNLTEDLCRPNPCGRDAECTPGKDRDGNDRPVCTCIDNYIGDPLTGCRPELVSDMLECVSDSECPSGMTCSNNRCVDPCIGACGEGAYCDVIQGRPRCSCPQYYQGNPTTRCYLLIDRHR